MKYIYALNYSASSSLKIIFVLFFDGTKHIKHNRILLTTKSARFIYILYCSNVSYCRTYGCIKGLFC